ncbi:MAG: hypothetical protein FVQ79_00010 [Planctomycetes bacterium]|nr:hypothetical protein [Planctomycetota bacterium]
MATDSWDVVDELIDTLTNNPTNPWISISVRSDGDVVVVYAGDTDQVMGGKKERVDANIRTGGTWGGAVALDAAGDIHYGNPNVVKGPLTDDMHILWQQTANIADPPASWAQTEARTLDPANVLSTLVTDAQDTDTELLSIQNPVSYEDSGTQRMLWGGKGHRFWPCTEDAGDDILFGTAVDSPILPNIESNGEISVVTLVELDGVIHDLYSSSTDLDLYYTKSTDDGATWDTPTEELDAISCLHISANIYTRGGDTVLAYLYDDGGVQKYNEKVLSAGGGFIEQGTLGSLLLTGLAGTLIAKQGFISAGIIGDTVVTGLVGTRKTGWIDQATVGPIAVTGAQGQFISAWVKQATEGPLGVTGEVGTLVTGVAYIQQALEGLLDVTGQAGVAKVGFISTGLQGDITVTGLQGVLVTGGEFIEQALIGNIGATGLAGDIVTGQGFISQALLGQVDVNDLLGNVKAGFVSQALEGALNLTGAQGAYISAWVKQAIEGAVVVIGGQGTLLANKAFIVQAQEGTIDVAGLVGVNARGLIDQATEGSVAIVGLRGTLILTESEEDFVFVDMWDNVFVDGWDDI